MSFLSQMQQAEEAFKVGVDADLQARQEALKASRVALFDQFRQYYGLRADAFVDENTLAVVGRLLLDVIDAETCKTNFCIAIDAAVASHT